jgi:hypothetical protein
LWASSKAYPLKEKKAIHEWLAGQLLPVPRSRGKGNDEELEDTGEEGPETGETSDEKRGPHQIGDTVTHKGVAGYKIQKFNDAGSAAYIRHPVSGVGKWATLGRLRIEQTCLAGANQENGLARYSAAVSARETQIKQAETS